MPHRRAVGNAGGRSRAGRSGPLSLVCGGLRPPRPHPGGARAARRSAHPPTLGCSLCGGSAPTPPPGSPVRPPRDRPAPSPLAGEGWGEGCAARQRGEMEPHAPIGSAARSRAATARASAAGICFDRDAGYLARPPPPSRRRLRPTRPPRILPSCGGCFDRHARIPRRAPTPPTERWRVSRHPSLLPAPPRVEREPDRPRALYRRRAAPRSRRRFAKVSRGRELA